MVVLVGSRRSWQGDSTQLELPQEGLSDARACSRPMRVATSLVLASLLLLAAAPLAQASTVTVTLDLDVSGADYKTCDVRVPAGANGGEVLDAAVEQGCILLWTADEFPGYGRYVVCIDALCGAVATYWAFYLDGAYSDVGIDAYAAVEGDVLGFDYQQWVLVL